MGIAIYEDTIMEDDAAPLRPAIVRPSASGTSTASGRAS